MDLGRLWLTNQPSRGLLTDSLVSVQYMLDMRPCGVLNRFLGPSIAS